MHDQCECNAVWRAIGNGEGVDLDQGIGQQGGCAGLAITKNSMSAATNYLKIRAFDGSPRMKEETAFSDA